MIISGALFYPFACVIGRWAKTTPGGVPAYPVTRYVHNFPNVGARQQSMIVFRRYSVLSSLFVGYMYANYATSRDAIFNDWFNRPDLKPYPAMVKKEGIVKMQEDYLMEKLYPWRQKSDYKKSTWFRFLFPDQADWTLKQNPYQHMEARDYSFWQLFE